jgi:hydrogenase nickel incorporation protein HypA/HybF
VHEMSIALEVVERIASAGPPDGAGPAESVLLRVGELAGVVPDALDFSFSLACEGTPLAGAELVTEVVPGRAWCAPCDREWSTGMPPDLCCPACDGPSARLVSGRELQIVSVRWADAATRVPADEEH